MKTTIFILGNQSKSDMTWIMLHSFEEYAVDDNIHLIWKDQNVLHGDGYRWQRLESNGKLFLPDGRHVCIEQNNVEEWPKTHRMPFDNDHYWINDEQSDSIVECPLDQWSPNWPTVDLVHPVKYSHHFHWCGSDWTDVFFGVLFVRWNEMRQEICLLFYLKCFQETNLSARISMRMHLMSHDRGERPRPDFPQLVFETEPEDCREEE